ncbi:carboxypeptidase-like regulatory domain-containing protein [Myxococcota bacterium]|nr:carboxypeptidase-like regulatory domain-containing protein [Myxococcota bacterium]
MTFERPIRAAVALVYLAALVAAPVRAHADESGAPKPDIDVRVRVPVALMVITPTGKIGSSDTSNIIRIADAALAETTDLQVKPYDDPGCRGKPTCYVESVRSDYLSRLATFRDDEDPSRFKPFGEVKSVLKGLTPPAPHYLVVLSSSRQADGSDRLSTLLLDTDEALGYIHEANERNERRDAEKEEALEDRIVQYAKRASPAPLVVKKDEQVEGYIRELFQSEFRDELEKAGHWQPYGHVVVEVSEPGLEIELDGAKIGTTKPGRTVLGNVTPGDRTLRISRAGFLTAEQRVTVRTGETATVEIAVAREPQQVARTMRTGMFWGGIATAAAGVAITALAISAASSSDRTVVCIHNGSGCPGSAEFIKLGAGTDPLTDVTADPSEGKVIPLAPLGYSLIGAGATWSLSSVIGDQDSLPIVELGLGLGLFAASLFASMALDGSNPIACGQDSACSGR